MEQSPNTHGLGRKTRTKSQRNGKRRALAVLMLLSSSFAPGCSLFTSLQNNIAYCDPWNDWVISHRNSAWSARAWHRRKQHFCNQKYLVDFCKGFRAGYEDVAAGANGCTPAFPPRDYWGWKYQNAEGQAKVSAWFSGYPHGARAAEEDGIGNWSQLQLSSTGQAEYAQFGLLEQPNVYPQPGGGQPLCGACGPFETARPATPVPMTEPVPDAYDSGALPPEGLQLPNSLPQNVDGTPRPDLGSFQPGPAQAINNSPLVIR